MSKFILYAMSNQKKETPCCRQVKGMADRNIVRTLEFVTPEDKTS